jgi:hypothetical protein
MLRLRKCIGCPSKGERSNLTIGGTTWLLLGIPSGSAKIDTRSSRLFRLLGIAFCSARCPWITSGPSHARGSMCRPQYRKNFNTKEAGRTTEGHGARVRSASREAQSAFYSVVLRRPPCFLRVEILADAPRPRSPRRKTRGELVRSHIDAIQAIVLGLFNRVGEFAATEAIPFIALLACGTAPLQLWKSVGALVACFPSVLLLGVHSRHAAPAHSPSLRLKA